MAWAAVLAAGIGAAGGMYASKQANKRTGNEKEMERFLNQNAQQAGAYGTQMLGRSQQALDPVYEYFNRLATGDRQELTQFLAPELSAQGDAARRAFQTGSELAPRSGMGVESVSRIPMNNAASLGQIIAGARPAGIQGLATLGTNLAGFGLQGLGQGSAGAGQALGYSAGRRADANATGAAAGESAYELFKLMQSAFQQNKQQKAADFWGNPSNTSMLQNYMSMLGSGWGG